MADSQARAATAPPSSARTLLADADTPLIRNAWYVVALSEEITRTPLGREAMETSLVLYRRADGTPVALQNRCCHRSFPLAHGTLEGDAIRCGYHGLKYAADGRCVEIPMQDKIPPQLRLRAYPLVERAPLVWAWFGDPAAPDESLLPHPDWLGAPDWDMYIGYLPIASSYVHMHENLLDLSHLSFLHPRTFGTPEYARAPVELAVAGADIQAWRHVECMLPDIYAVPLGWQGQRARRSSGSRFVAPGLHVNTGILSNLERPTPADETPPTIRVAQVITPIDRHRLHYWFVGCRNFARGRPDIDAFMREAQIKAFTEDQFAMEQIARMQQVDQAGDYTEMHIPTDAAGLAMRRHLAALAAREA
ncbi:MAG: aromatic ring-hydroxylating dioxygenase subunit alpha [Gammaproteobacteria bacterium]|nr:aromatic ring-hydroxylating dioxygenase subunit alpha [Gammaproteobacteria bacterium]